MGATRQLRDAFLAFRDQCIWLRTCFNTFAHLFHAEHEPPDLLQRTAAAFFQELNDVLQLNIVLHVCRITDGARVMGKECLTVANLNELLKGEGLMSEGIRNATQGLMRYRKLVEKARHKLAAHLDKHVVLANQTLSEHDEEDVDDFLRHLQLYNDEVGRAVGEGPLDFTATPVEGDVTTLCQVLRAGLEAKEEK